MPGKEFKIRKAKPGDEPAIHEAHMRSIREICVKDHGEKEIRGWGYREPGNRWQEAIANWHVWVVEGEGKIYGHACIRIFQQSNETKARILGLYLTPEVLHQGFGRKCAELMLDQARGEGARSITLDSSITARNFYKKLGFVDSGPMKFEEIGGHPVSAYPMEFFF